MLMSFADLSLIVDGNFFLDFSMRLLVAFGLRWRLCLAIETISSKRKTKMERHSPTAMTRNAPVKFLKDSEGFFFRELFPLVGFSLHGEGNGRNHKSQ